MKREAKRVGNITARVKKQDESKHWSGNATNKEVAEGQVQYHEVKVGPELPKGRIEKGQKHHQVPIGPQAEDDDQQEGAGDQGGGVDNLLDVSQRPIADMRHRGAVHIIISGLICKIRHSV